MIREEINNKVKDQLELWTILQKKRNKNIVFTKGASDLLCQLIENIEIDQSNHWIIDGGDFVSIQEYAISLIPNALNDIYPYPYKNRRGYNFGNIFNDNYTISSWELLHSITKILDSFCFIPKKRQ
jgi:hypothetical protein